MSMSASVHLTMYTFYTTLQCRHSSK